MERGVRWKVFLSCWFASEYPSPGVNNVGRKRAIRYYCLKERVKEGGTLSAG